MFHDARRLALDSRFEADVCIVGAGPAGITLAKELLRSSLRLCLLESGGLKVEREPQELSRGESVGPVPYPLDGARVRAFGGTSWDWAGWCRPLEPLDFEARRWVPYSGWPFDRRHLDPWYRRAHSLCQLGPFAYEPAAWRRGEGAALSFPPSRLESRLFRFSPPTRFGTRYRRELGRAENLKVLLHASAVGLETNESGERIVRVEAATLGGNRFSVFSRIVILAAGGIENPRLLLLSNRVHREGLGNDHELVGRFFMEHPYADVGFFSPSPSCPSLAFYARRREGRSGASVAGVLALAAPLLRAERLVGVVLSLRPGYTASPAFLSRGVTSLLELLGAFRRRSAPPRLARHLGNVLAELDHVAIAAGRKLVQGHSLQGGPVRVRCFVEAAPNPDSRISVSREKDRLGMRRVQIDWRLSPIDHRSLERARQVLDEEVRRAGLGHLEFHPSEGSPLSFEVGGHHLGTTRMHPDPRRGVVDADGKVHGISNLFVAGGSVFPTSGSANPTLTIVALAARLAAHVQALLAGIQAAPIQVRDGPGAMGPDAAAST